MWFVMTLAVACAVVAVGMALRQSAPPPRRSRRTPGNTDISVPQEHNDISVTPGR